MLHYKEQDDNQVPDSKKAARYDNDDDDIKLSFNRYKTNIQQIRNNTFEDDDDREQVKSQNTKQINPADDLFSPSSIPSTPKTPYTPEKNTSPIKFGGFDSPGDSPTPVRRLF